MYSSAPLTRVSSLAGRGFFSAEARRSVEASTADIAKCVSASLGGLSASKFTRPVFNIARPIRSRPTRVAMIPTRNPFIEESLRRFKGLGSRWLLLYLGQPVIFFENFTQ